MRPGRHWAVCCKWRLELRLQAPVRWADLPGWFYHVRVDHGQTWPCRVRLRYTQSKKFM
jgi:hypothetical protein